jgi:hypothetical protein
MRPLANLARPGLRLKRVGLGKWQHAKGSQVPTPSTFDRLIAFNLRVSSKPNDTCPTELA